MNFRNIISSIFSAVNTPTLEEFIEANKPVDLHHVEFLEKEYDRLYGAFYAYPIGR